MNNNKTEKVLEIEDLLNIGIALTAERDHNKLLEMILSAARRITKADAGTLFLLENNELVFKIIHNETLNIFKDNSKEEIELPNVPLVKENVAAYVALTKESVNIPDVYNSTRFNFSGPKKYDQITGYKTSSMLVIPLKDHQEQVIGVLQLINAQDETREVVPFAPYFEKVISSLASQAAITISNAKFLAAIENLLDSFVKVMATAIDARTPYNANHTRRVAKMTEKLIELINHSTKGSLASEHFDQQRTDQLIMAAWLHDIGKIAIPLKVMNKSSRLEDRLELVLQRLDYIAAKAEADYLRNKSESSNNKSLRKKYLQKLDTIKEAKNLIITANDPSVFVSEDMIERLKKIANLNYTDSSGEVQPWLKENELHNLSVAKGTLTEQERELMEHHVELAGQILELIPFPEELAQVPDWVVQHHEFLDGEGYPKQLVGTEISLEGRVLTLVDIFDALTAADRPYKQPLSVDKALNILASMTNEGKLDAELFSIFRQGQVWTCLNEEDEDIYNLKIF
ncbi:HD domain-containing phosphohydrolase [Fuchsiella alkaliacetigena]|uniref:HD domain-containing phosphohydrolase n=1 Tax=Fuchsiella alkaliacetigena TaxID=957042 RepID=UPI00200A1446|nr:HD family phosphohydrolase [Fuchsiella alkaliacetigena]MCK8824081.1 GAF domain-containing protein [Fuchsiella alkaliacetigena]